MYLFLVKLSKISKLSTRTPQCCCAQRAARSGIQKLVFVFSPSGNIFTVTMMLLGQWNGGVMVFTFVAFFHVRTQPHIVRTGTCVLGGMGWDLRCRKTQIVTASVGLGAELTGIWSCSRMEEKTSYFSNNLFPALGKETSDPLKRPSLTPYLDLSGCLSIFTVCMVEWNLTKYYKNFPNA